ncbi:MULTISPECIES: phosphate ABC transporter permease subunit PstC [Nocardioides]|uniref:Phosphate transport system permease protein n=2 Tax=Nocardioides kribbensis TaxID=305517 RepID=A0ABV1P205_9ACTN|nr:phosphate ABC transporter permease subunit PstC [Nocardioides sp. P86]MCM3517089.1 phosphate ABC transporter permease subunit PstC [Nocardioides sp. P86]
MTSTSTEPRGGPTEPLEDQVVSRRGDVVFAGLARGAGLLIMLALAGVALFLLLQSIPAFSASGDQAYGKDNIVLYVWPLLYGTVIAAVIALIIATPLAIGVALVISHYAPRRLARYIGYAIDLLAAVPSVVYGLWGRETLQSWVFPVYQWLADNLGFIPLFAGPVTTGRTILTAGVVLAVMALPIITALCREVFAQTPRMHEEAALALGATRWEMIRMTVFPYSRSGVTSAVMLGLGRALGETMAVAMVLAASGVITINLISSQNPSTIAASIALNYSNASGIKTNVLIFGGLVLFVVTFAVNFLGRWLAARGQAKG